MTNLASASWAVEYTDGTHTHQYDPNNPARHPASGEVPYRAIEWPRVKALTFESQWVKQTFDVVQPPEGYQLSLRSRHFANFSGESVHCFMVVISRAGEEVNDESVASVLYWFPDGSSHLCPHFNCAEVSTYGSKAVHGGELALSEVHELGGA